MSYIARKLRFAMVALPMAVFLSASPSQAATITVSDLSDAGTDTLRDAIASASGGDTIDFSVTGMISLTTGELVVDKDLAITGPGFADLTVSAGGLSRVFRINSGITVTISAMTIRDGFAGLGGGILSEGTLNVDATHIRENDATLGGGIHIGAFAGATTLTDTTIRDNTAEDGAGVSNGDFDDGGSTLTIVECTITENIASGGGPFAVNAGGGVLNYGTVELIESTVTANEAGVGGGVHSAPMAQTGPITLSIDDTDVTDNTAKVAGGVLNFGVAEIVNSSTVSFNDAVGGVPLGEAEGGGIVNAGELTIILSYVTYNEAAVGAGISSSGELTVTESTIESNVASDGGVQTSNNRGGGILSTGVLTIDTGSMILGNSAGYGGGIFSSSRDAIAAISESAVSGNTGQGGAGIANGSSSEGGGMLTISASVISDNIATPEDPSQPNATSDGGGIINFGALAVSDSVISDNEATSGAGINNAETTLMVCSGDPTIECEDDDECMVPAAGTCGLVPSVAVIVATTLSGNRSSIGGGVLNRSTLTVTDSTFSGNRADRGGAIYNDQGDLLTVTNSTLSDNVAGTRVTASGLVKIDPSGGGCIYNNAGTAIVANCTCHAGSIANESGLFLVRNSVVANSPIITVCSGDADETCNTNDDCDALDVGTCVNGPHGNCDGNISSQGYNLDTGTLCGFDGTVTGDLENVSANLGPLQDNGGLTDTRLPMAISPAVDTGHPALPGSGGTACEMADQRGQARWPAGDPRCDIGAAETTCGNGIIESNESCDVGDVIDDDGCDSNCQPSGCGNAHVAGSEACDDGNSDDGDGCDSSLTCTAGLVSDICTVDSDCNTDIFTPNGVCANCTLDTVACGDDIINADEECDDANMIQTDDCVNCKDASCGDGYKWDSEECDDGNLSTGDGCTSECISEFCGDGIVNNGGEACDDGNVDDGDGCDSSRTCLAGADPPSCSSDADCDTEPGDGSGVCANCSRIAVCGDGIVNNGTEACDDGNGEGGDGCSSDCTVEECGNGTIDVGEACDDGNKTNGDGCDDRVANGGNCTATACGNGVLTDLETCDDGNTSAGDYCSANCTAISGFCGDGTTQTNEQCDDSNSDNNDGCNALCLPESCGDGIVNNGTEACDDGNMVSGDYCADDCSAVTGRCGDGAVQALLEQCDDGDLFDDDGCDSNCTTTGCGNGVLTAGEICDDGNTQNGDYCSFDCATVTGACGDAVLQELVEECDDGNQTNGDGCDDNTTAGGNCTNTGCGNGVVTGIEACDDGDAVGTGYCNAACTLIVGSCDDGVVQTLEEECDDDGLQTATCETSCQIPRCGDTVTNAAAGETCDDGNNDLTDPCPDGLDGSCVIATCGDGFECTDPACMTAPDSMPEECDEGGIDTQDCDFNCTLPLCGDGNQNMAAGEGCDDGNTAEDDGCSSTCGNELIQDDDQVDCILRMNKAGKKLVKRQTKETSGCVAKGLKGLFTDAQECLTLDPKLRVQKAKDKVTATEAACADTPGFSFAGASGMNAAAIAESVGAISDIFGADLDEAIITEKEDKIAHNCQRVITKAANRIIDTHQGSFLRCKSRQLKNQLVDSAGDLSSVCFGELAADARGRLAKAIGKITKGRAVRCNGVDLGAAFPGECMGLMETEFDDCVAAHFNCRACLMINGMDALSGDCDEFDNGMIDGSCP